MTGRAIPIVLGGFAAAVLIAAFGLSSTARLVPLSVSAAVLSLILVESIAGRPADPPASRSGDVWREMAWLLALPLVIAVAGLTAGLPVFLIAYLRLRARTSWATACLPGAVCWIVLYAGLHRLLGVTLS